MPHVYPGHERSLTQVKFNLEGDLIFSCSKDHIINVWFSHNGERLGTYDGHNGTVWTVDVDCAFLLSPQFTFLLLMRLYIPNSTITIHGLWVG